MKRKYFKQILVLLVFIMVLLPDRVYAGQFFGKNLDIPYLMFGLGAEYSTFTRATDNLKDVLGGNYGGTSDAWGFAFALQAGFRLGWVRLGALYQYTMLDNIEHGLESHKLYLDIITAIRLWRIEIPLRFAIGWAGLKGGNEVRSGMGMKFGTGIDFEIIRLISLGVFIDGDVQMFWNGGFGVAGGFTVGGRIGLHF